jgi:hypothetical protein
MAIEIASAIAVASFLSIIVNRLIEALIVPLFNKFQWDKFWLMYVAWGLSAVLVFISGINLFADVLPDEIVGKLMTALVAGGGANFLHDIFDNRPVVE